MNLCCKLQIYKLEVNTEQFKKKKEKKKNNQAMIYNEHAEIIDGHVSPNNN